MTAWISIALESIAWILALYLIGAVLLFACNSKSIKTYAFAPVVSIAFLGIVTLGTHLYAWTAFNVVLLLVATLAICFACRAIISRKQFVQTIEVQFSSISKSASSILAEQLIAASIGVLVGFACTLYTFTGIALDSPIGLQDYDNPFHFSIVRLILDSGVASPIGAGSVMGDSNAIYPSLWHALVAMNCQIFGTSATNSAWVVCIMCIGFISTIGTALLTKVLFKQPNLFTIFLAAVLPTVTTYSITHYMVFGSLFANLTGLALVPMALAWIVYLQKNIASCKFATKVLVLATATIVSTIALGLAHPSTVFILFIFLVPFAVSKIQNHFAKVLILIGAIGCWIALMKSSLFFRTINCLDRVGNNIEAGQLFATKLHLDYAAMANLNWLPLAICIACIAVGLVIALLLRKKFKNSWFIVSIALIIAQMGCSYFPENWFSIILTGFWYRDFPRLYVTFALMGTCLFAYIPTLIEMLFSSSGALRKNSVLRIACIAIACLVCLLVASRGNVYRVWLNNISSADALSTQEIAYMKQIATITQGALVLNNADDNSVWAYPTFGINALAKGRPANQMSSMPDNEYLLVEGIDKIGEDSAYGELVRQAAKDTGLSYVMKASDKPATTMRFNELDKIDYQWHEAITRVNKNTSGLKLIYELDGMQLYRLL